MANHYYNNDNYYINNTSNSYLDYVYYLISIPLHLWFFITILLFVLGFSWYINYENKLEEMVNQVKLFLMLSPLLLLLLVHCLSSSNGSFFPLFTSLPEKDALHRAGGSPWGVGFLLLFLIFMISYQSSFHERWFPLIT